jgi:hypothetical protein
MARLVMIVATRINAMALGEAVVWSMQVSPPRPTCPSHAHPPNEATELLRLAKHRAFPRLAPGTLEAERRATHSVVALHGGAEIQGPKKLDDIFFVRTHTAPLFGCGGAELGCWLWGSI